MRPLNLRVKGFTSFRDEQEIDFTELDLFALWGPTGSGKSSILDAITYALYGKVERIEGVRDTLTGLITHGQPRMAVTLDFECGDKGYRVTRFTPRSGQSKVRLERREGEDWVSFGEGADSVREVNRIVPEVVGLDYDAFTRSVVLPQGKFAEFLTGDADKRRKILTELLGLELFGRMAQRSNEIARDARSAYDAKSGLLSAEYAGIDEAAVTRAEEDAAAAQAAATAASDAEATLEQLEDEWSETQKGIETLEDLSGEIEDLRSSYESHSLNLDRQVAELEKAGERAREARAQLESCRAEHERISTERGRFENAHGTLEDLASLRGGIERLQNIERELKRASNSAAEQKQKTAEAKKELAAHDAEVARADGDFQRAQEEVELREQAYHLAHRRDLVGALTHDLAPGDPCPVCETPLKELPEAEAGELKSADRARVAAQKALKKTQEAASRAHVAHARASEALEGAVRRGSEGEGEVERKTAELEDARSQLDDRLAALKGDRLIALDKLADELRGLHGAEKKAAAAHSEATNVAGSQQQSLSDLATKVAVSRAAIENAPLKPLLVQVKKALGRAASVKAPQSFPEDPSKLMTSVSRLVEQIVVLESELREEVAARGEHMISLITKAREVLPPGVDSDLDDLKEMLVQVRAVCRGSSQKAALAAEEAKSMKVKLAKRATLEAEIEGHRREQATYVALGRELKNDRIVQFLQAEALAVLATAAGEHLRELSDGRYRLGHEDDRFYVIDAWNGDERRSVRTLSGGETFLASLGLALALSEQVQLLAVTETARLQSLFLDEGFGSLDAETLDVVVGAISRLGSDGRLVGVITHVADLADAMPVKIEVTKGPRTSTIEVPASLPALT
ncbi:MAG: SMC family ATPase [Actinomycetota bacterium]|nr:SMC family ATPase [Actinomycetota bacterium]